VLSAKSLTISNSTITSCTSDGIAAYGTGTTVTVTGSTVTGNAGNGLDAYSSGGITVSGTAITNNAGNGLNASSNGGITVSGAAITNNTGYAIGAEANTRISVGAGVTVSGNGAGLRNAINHRGGATTANETWGNFPGLPWEVTNGELVQTGTLTIAAGTIVRFTSSGGLYITGILSAIGTSANPITLTSAKATPAPGDWTGIIFQPNNTGSQIKYATVAYGGNTGVYGASIMIHAGSQILDHVTVQNSGASGIKLDGGVASLSFVTMVGSAVDGFISISSQASTIINSSFIGNSAGAENANFNFVIPAQFNYWGSPSGPSGSGAGTGQYVNSAITFEPWLLDNASGPQYFTSLSQQNRTFDPVVGVNMTLTFATALSGAWSVTIKNSTNTAVRTITGTGATGSISWDGKSDGGILQPDGNYTYELNSTATGNPPATTAVGRTILNASLQLTLTPLAVSLPLFSPNADGQRDTTTFSSTASLDGASWTLNITTSANALVRTVSGAGANISYVWDGKNGSGVTQPDDVYTATLTATAGTAPPASVSATTTLDNTLPTLTITAPAPGTVLSNLYQNFTLTGTATDTHLNYWQLQYGLGSSPSTWLNNNESLHPSPVINGTLTTWNTAALSDGTYSLRLFAYDLAGNSATSAPVTVTLGSFTVAQSALEFNAGSTVQYTSVVPFQLTETLVIKNRSGQTVRTIFTGLRQAGTYTDTWNGRSDAGFLLPDDGYLYVATATDGTHTLTLDLSTQYYPGYADDDLVLTPSGGFDPFNNQPFIGTYSFPNNTIPVLVYAMLFNSAIDYTRCGPPFSVCIAWAQYQTPRTHPFTWSGADATGAFRPDMVHAVGWSVAAFPQNMVLLNGVLPTVTGLGFSPPIYSPDLGTQEIAFDMATPQTGPVTITITYLNQSSLSVLRTITLSNQQTGRVTVDWDGNSDNGTRVATGQYTVTVTATDAAGYQGTGQGLTIVRY
jgi:flagellar hook assembly protein FlgD